MRSASSRLIPGTRVRSSMLAACTPLSPPKCWSKACRRFAPMPPIDCSVDVLRDLARCARCGVVITPRGGLDVEAAVFVALHARMIEDHTARHRRFSHGVTHVEAFDTLHGRRQSQAILQGSQPFVLRGFLRESLANGE